MRTGADGAPSTSYVVRTIKPGATPASSSSSAVSPAAAAAAASLPVPLGREIWITPSDSAL